MRLSRNEKIFKVENLKQEYTFVELLKACAKRKDLCGGAKLHADVVKTGLLEKSTYIASTLISMYAKCGALAKAHLVLEGLPLRDISSWNALVAGYANQGRITEAFNCFEALQIEGFLPDRITFTCILKASGRTGDVHRGRLIHDQIVHMGLLKENFTVLGNALVDMYAKCGMVVKAQEVLEDLPVRNVVSWSTLISGYLQQGQGFKALDAFEKMQKEGISPDEVTFICVLKACGKVGDIDRGMQIHDVIIQKGLLEKNIVLGNALLDMYVKCGLLTKAREVLQQQVLVRNVVSWSTLISGYAKEEQGHEALDCFYQMQREGISPNVVTLISILKACGSIRAIDEGKRIHEDITNSDLLEKNITLGNALVDMYVKCGALGKAQQVHGSLPVRDTVSWNALITGYAQQEQGEEAIKCFEVMQKEGLSPNEVTLASILKACGNAKAINKGREIHEQIINCGLLEKNPVLGTALVDMYCKCGELVKAHKVLEHLPHRDIMSWNALIAGYSQQGQGSDALACFELMQRESFCPDEATFVSILKVCGRSRAIDKGRQFHNNIVTRGFIEKSIILGNALVDMYAKCCVLAEARNTLEDLPVRDIISWNAMISGYAHEEEGHGALDCFGQMQREGHLPNEITFISILKACSSIGATDKGNEIHGEVVSSGLLERSNLLRTALVDMYAKFGLLAKAHQVLEELTVRDTVSWNALIAGYAQEGYYDETLNCVKQMQMEGFSPNDVTFLCILNACSHAGKVDEAQMYYDKMSGRYGITPKSEHHMCMLMAFGNVGKFDKLLSMIQTMPSSDNPSIWLALLDASRKWGNVKLGRLAFEQVILLDSNIGAAYVLMVNIYVAAGMHDDAEVVKDIRTKNILRSKVS